MSYATDRSRIVAAGDVLRRLFESYAVGDAAGFRSAADMLIREERAKNHRLLADDLDRILRTGSAPGGAPVRRLFERDVPRDPERGMPLVEIIDSLAPIGRLVVRASTRKQLDRIVRENERRDLLVAAGLGATQRVLFFGPPGCGKTLAAHTIATQLGVPLVLVRFDAIVSSLLGETAANLNRVFNFAASERFVVLFDEFDAVGKDRDDPVEHGELKRVVNALLQQIDAFKGEGLLIAATNHESILDTAIWRRFDEVVEFPPPTAQDRILLLRNFLGGFKTGGISLTSLAARLDGATGSDIEKVAKSAARSAVLEGRSALARADIESAMTDYLSRRRSIQAATQRT